MADLEGVTSHLLGHVAGRGPMGAPAAWSHPIGALMETGSSEGRERDPPLWMSSMVHCHRAVVAATQNPWFQAPAACGTPSQWHGTELLAELDWTYGLTVCWGGEGW